MRGEELSPVNLRLPQNPILNLPSPAFPFLLSPLSPSPLHPGVEIPSGSHLAGLEAVQDQLEESCRPCGLAEQPPVSRVASFTPVPLLLVV